MRIHAIHTPVFSFLLGFIVSDEIKSSKPIAFLIDTGSESTVVSATDLDPNFDCNTLQRGTDSIGATGMDITYLLHNVDLYIFTKKEKFRYIRSFDEMGVLPRRYNKETKKLLPIPSLLGMDIIGKQFKLVYSKKKTILKSRRLF
jgi:hypothetical protein